MHIWRCTRLAHGYSCQQGDGGWPTGCQHHGQQTHGQCHAIWHVPIDGQSHGGRRNSRSAGCLGADAMHSNDHGPLGARGAYCIAWQHASPEQQLKADVHVGWRDLYQPSGAIHCHGALTLYFH